MIDQPLDFEIRVPDEALDDLHRRLAATRWPDPPGEGWGFGTDAAWLRELVAYWQDGFDWRRQEAWLGSVLPGERVRIRGLDVHFSRIPGRGPSPLPLLLLHGWPSSFVEMHRLVGPLSDPLAHGGSPKDAFDVVVASIPGHGFSSAASDPRFGADDAADLFRDLMVEVLGHDRFGVHGGDRGAFVATGLGHRHLEHIAGIHLSLPMGIAAPIEQRSAEESAWLEDVARWQTEEAGYSAIQSTRPLSLAYGLTDSPVGLAGWILEKWFAWSDCDGDPLNCFTRDELLTNVMIYWLSGSIGSSMQFYWAHRNAPPAVVRPERIEVPTGIALFPKEVMRPPRSAVERKYRLTRWTEMSRGGHFPALEAPEALTRDIRAFFRSLRSP
ncbi:MAG: epoxide hydrolase family protein [Myxococcota bacterium]